MTGVLGVHGIRQQQGGRTLLLKTKWRPALVDGIELAVGRDGRKAFRPRLDLAFYGDLFMDALSRSVIKPPKGESGLEGVKLSDEEVEYFEEIGDELRITDAALDKGMKELPRPVARLLAWLEGRSGVGAAALFFGELRQVRRYQLDEDFAARVRQRVLDLLGESEVVVGHSLGSVVAAETLGLGAEAGGRRLVTLGSPLALATVRRRLRVELASVPVTAWTNIFDPRDPVSLAGGIGPWRRDAGDVQVNNQWDPHAVEHYLCKRETGLAVTNARESVR